MLCRLSRPTAFSVSRSSCHRARRGAFSACGHQSFARSSSSSTVQIDESLQPLVELEGVRLGYSSSHTPFQTNRFDLTIHRPSLGGHVLLGRNGSGKTLVSSALFSNRNGEFLLEGTFETDRNWFSNSIQHVSFESHEDLLKQGVTAYKAISGGGNLSKAAQFLVVRFGLFPLLHRNVNTLSTGEIRKVMLVRALAERPRLLVLDNAFDGLDVPSRQSLADLVSKTLRGFRPDILVQAVDSRSTAHTQVMIITQRAEEIVDEIEFISYFDSVTGELCTSSRDGRPGEALLASALGVAESSCSVDDKIWLDPSLPSLQTIQACWEGAQQDSTHGQKLVSLRNLDIRRGDAKLLSNINWTVRQGERWLVAGGNGAGKSTWSRLLAKNESDVDRINLSVHVSEDNEHELPGERRRGIGWVSTELHMKMARSSKQARDILLHDGSSPVAIGELIAAFFGVGDRELLDRPFSELSQGQQKLLLIAAALSSRPRLLVLDEPCQGLDLLNRRRVLGVVERVCNATDMSLVYITHHLEELLPSVTHVLHLRDGHDLYQGPREAYDPDKVLAS